MSITIRPYGESDRERLKDITAVAFPGASVDKLMEQRYGVLGGTPWDVRKRAAIDADCDANPNGVFVAEDAAGEVVGYITCRLWPEVRTGWIANLAVDPRCQGHGTGRKLLQTALDYFRAAGMTHAKIETLAINEVGQHLYPAVGFEELVRQVHYALEL
ncbi:MAG: GNAT family N-acetyltransferase [Fimbriimonadaceae bacterium]|nr:GNAT family N-acetyltransferase [Fimbriimonadaceae bacterium]